MEEGVPLRRNITAKIGGDISAHPASSDVGGSVALTPASSDDGGRLAQIDRLPAPPGAARRRPRSEKRRSHGVVSARMRSEVRDELDALAGAAGIGPSAFAARILIDHIGLTDKTERLSKPVDPVTLQHAKSLLGELGKIGGLLKSLKGVALDQGMVAILHRLDDALTPLRALHADLQKVTDALGRPASER